MAKNDYPVIVLNDPLKMVHRSSKVLLTSCRYLQQAQQPRSPSQMARIHTRLVARENIRARISSLKQERAQY